MLTFERGEEVLELLQRFCRTLQIGGGFFSGIGTALEVTLSFYNVQTEEYEDVPIDDAMEIASLNGNISVMEGEPVIHVHGVFSKETMETVGGHIKRLVVAGTCEVALVAFDDPIVRRHDPATGLNLMQE